MILPNRTPAVLGAHNYHFVVYCFDDLLSLYHFCILILKFYRTIRCLALVELRLDNNSLQTIPESLCNLKRLKILTLDNNLCDPSCVFKKSEIWIV